MENAEVVRKKYLKYLNHRKHYTAPGGKERAAENRRRYRATPQGRARTIRATHKYRGVPVPLWPEPAGCECCGRRPKDGRHLCVDHDHETGRFRGWLCGHCNRSIGQLGDNVADLMRAVRYLQIAELI